jgi:hypothetical protein
VINKIKVQLTTKSNKEQNNSTTRNYKNMILLEDVNEVMKQTEGSLEIMTNKDGRK